MSFRPPAFWVAGFLWLSLAALAGLAMFLGTIRGSPLPPVLRLMHVHGALVGGVAQIILGAMLAFISPLLLTGRDRPESRPLLFTGINGGAIGVVLGFALRDNRLVGVAGLIVLLAFLTVLSDLVHQSRRSLVSPPLNLWFYGLALVALFGGLAIGEGVAFHLLPSGLRGAGRLAHVHLNLLGFVTMTIVGTMHNLFPTILDARLHSPLLARLTFWLLPAGIILLVSGFALSLVPLEIAAGVILIAAVGLFGYNILRTWLTAGRPRRAPSDHLLMATFFLITATVTGLLVAINASRNPPFLPFGTLHLMAYTHLALVGFILQTIMGALSHLLPITLAVNRTKSNKRRGPYLAELTALIERGRRFQLGALNLGTMGLALVAALVWQYPLSSAPVQAVAWASAGLLLLGLGLFLWKLGLAILRRPEE